MFNRKREIKELNQENKDLYEKIYRKNNLIFDLQQEIIRLETNIRKFERKTTDYSKKIFDLEMKIKDLGGYKVETPFVDTISVYDANGMNVANINDSKLKAIEALVIDNPMTIEELLKVWKGE